MKNSKTLNKNLMMNRITLNKNSNNILTKDFNEFEVSKFLKENMKSERKLADVTALSYIHYRHTFAIDYLKGCDNDFWPRQFNKYKLMSHYVSHFHFLAFSHGCICKLDLVSDGYKKAVSKPLL